MNWFYNILKHFSSTTITKRVDEILQNQNWWNDESSETKAKKIDTDSVKKEIDETNTITPMFCHPKPGCRITSQFGNRTLKINGENLKNFHSGIDFGGYGICLAVEDVIIQKVLGVDKQYPCRFKFDRKRGWINANVPKGRAWTPYVIAIGKNTKTLYKYKHVTSSRKPGDHINAGEPICISDNLGYSMGAHLHFETWLIGKNGKHNYPDDPVKVLRKFGVEV